MKSRILHAVWCNISGEAVGGIWDWSRLEVKGFSTCAASSKRRATALSNWIRFGATVARYWHDLVSVVEFNSTASRTAV